MQYTPSETNSFSGCQEFPAFCGTRSYIAVNTTLFTCRYAEPDQSIPWPPPHFSTSTSLCRYVLNSLLHFGSPPNPCVQHSSVLPQFNNDCIILSSQHSSVLPQFNNDCTIVSPHFDIRMSAPNVYFTCQSSLMKSV